MTKFILIPIFFLTVFTMTAQDDDDLKTEEVNIVKPYTPKIKDAFKIKKNPVISASEISSKKEVTYTINSFPVASTFTPSKGQAQEVAKKKRALIYENYASVGFGNYTTPKIEAFVHTSTTRYNDIGARFNFHASQGGLNDVALDNDFIDTSISAYYKNSVNDFDWKTGVKYHYQKQNWYGLPSENSLTDAQIKQIDPEQVYNGFNIDGDITYYDATFTGVKINMNLFTDAYNSSEFQALVVPKFEFGILNEWLKTDLRLEYITGSFDQNYLNTNALNYSFYNLGFGAKLPLDFDLLHIDLGGRLVYTVDATNDAAKLFLYPDVTATYELIQNIMTIYTSATGDLHQQSYQKFVHDNLYVSPTLRIDRTHEKYKAKLGLKGKLASNMSFNMYTSYKDENNKPLYKLNTLFPTIKNNYHYANSFTVVYDDVQTLAFAGELSYDFSKAFKLGGSLNYNIYKTSLQDEAWNLPTLKSSVFAKYDANKISVGTNLFIVGERKDQYVDDSTITKITNKSYIDLNVNIGYRFTSRLHAFINGNNLFGNNYQKITNYNVQGIQVLGGVTYKFDL